MEQVRHTLETVQREVPSSQYAAETQASSVRIVTPLYKLEKKPVLFPFFDFHRNAYLFRILRFAWEVDSQRRNTCQA